MLRRAPPDARRGRRRRGGGRRPAPTPDPGRAAPVPRPPTSRPSRCPARSWWSTRCPRARPASRSGSALPSGSGVWPARPSRTGRRRAERPPRSRWRSPRSGPGCSASSASAWTTTSSPAAATRSSAAELVVQVLEVCRVALPVSARLRRGVDRRRHGRAGAPDAGRGADDAGRIARPRRGRVACRRRRSDCGSCTPSNRPTSRTTSTSPSRIEGPLDVDALTAALTVVEARHETLRTSFELDGAPTADRRARARARARAVVDLAGADDPAAAVRERASRLLRRPVRPRRRTAGASPPAPASPTDHLLLIGYHHIVADGRSRELLREELVQLYDEIAGGATPDPTGPAGRYADVATHEQTHFASRRRSQRELDHWLRRARRPARPARAARRPPAPGPPADRGRPLRCRRPATTCASALAKLAADEGATLFMATLAGFVAARCTATPAGPTSSVGVPVAGRGRAEWADVVGPFVNTLVIRVDVSGRPDASATLLDRVRTATPRRARPPGRAVRAAGRRSSTRSATVRYPPLVQVLFQLRGPPADDRPDAGPPPAATCGSRPPAPSSTSSLDLEDNGRRLTTTLEYASELFERCDRRGSRRPLPRACSAAAVADPDHPIGALPLLTRRGTEERLASYRRGPEQPSSRSGCTSLVAAAGRPTDPAAIAVDRRRAEPHPRRARRDSQPAGPPPRERRASAPVTGWACASSGRPSAIVAVLAVLKCGATVVPLDPSYPRGSAPPHARRRRGRLRS